MVSIDVKYCSKCREDHPKKWFNGKHNQNCRKWRWAEKTLQGAIRRNLFDNEKRIDNDEEPLPLTLTTRDVIQLWDKQQGQCYYTEMQLTIPWLESSIEKKFGTSIDRINNELGYVVDNVAFTFHTINSKKNDLSLEEFYDVLADDIYINIRIISKVSKHLNLKFDPRDFFD